MALKTSIFRAKQNFHKVVKSVLSESSPGGLKNFLAKAVAGTLGLKIASACLGYLSSLLLARFLGVEGYGIYAYGLAWVTLLRIPAMLGLAPLVVREVAIYRSKKAWGLVRGILLWSNNLVLTASITIALFAAFAARHLLPDSSNQTLSVFWIAMVSLPLIAWGNIKQGAMQALNHIVKAQLPELVVRPLVLLGLLCGVYLLSGRELAASWVMGMYSIATGTSFLMVSSFLSQCLPETVKSASPEYCTKEWIRAALPMLFIGGMYIINNQADIIMLGALKEPATVGMYSVANRAASLIVFILVAVNTSFAPTFASLYATGNLERLQKVVTKSSRLTFLVALPVATGLIVFGHWFLILFGSEFTAAKTTLNILCLGQLFNAFVGSIAVLLNMTGYQNDVALGVGISAVVNITLNAALIPHWGATGAAVATTSSTILWNILLIILTQKKLRIYPTVVGKLKGSQL